MQDFHDRTEALGEAGFQSRVRQHETQRLRQTAVDILEVVFEGEVVGQIELADARGVAAAAEVLEQQRVIEFPQFVIGEAGLAADMDADPAAAHAMTGGLALGHVERVTERSQ